ncbi:hypothetical protein CapIbe_009793 [Capra ibex]
MKRRLLEHRPSSVLGQTLLRPPSPPGPGHLPPGPLPWVCLFPHRTRGVRTPVWLLSSASRVPVVARIGASRLLTAESVPRSWSLGPRLEMRKCTTREYV